MRDFIVLRQHIGDRAYAPGDTRQAEPADVAHLLAAGVLGETRVEPQLSTKGERKARKAAEGGE